MRFRLFYAIIFMSIVQRAESKVDRSLRRGKAEYGRPDIAPSPPGPPPSVANQNRGDSKPSTFVDPEIMNSYSISEPKVLIKDGKLISVWLMIKGAEVRIDFVPAGDQLWDRNMIHIVKSSSNSSLKIAPYVRKCHYASTTPHTFAAVSNCDGFLIGTIIVKDEFFILEPSWMRKDFFKEKRTDAEGAEPIVNRTAADWLRPENATDLEEERNGTETTISETVEGNRSRAPSPVDFNERADAGSDYFDYGLEHDFDETRRIFKRNAGDDQSSQQTSAFCGNVDESVASVIDEADSSKNPSEAVVYSASYYDHSRRPELLVELAVFADQALWRLYESLYGAGAATQLNDFLATLLNNVQLLYHHETINPKINFKVVRYEILKTHPIGLPPVHDAQTYLNYFCQYQKRLGSRNWDHALLFTGLDLVRNGWDRAISGMARVKGVCDPENSCLIAEARGFTSAFITTHEIGHSLGMEHDEPRCPSSFIMSQSLGAGKVVWSPCSVKAFQQFLMGLEYGERNCMKWTQEQTKAIEISGGSLPGQKYDADQQCALMYGRGYKETKVHLTPADRGICYMIWCRRDNFGNTITSHPALEGTNCARGKYCINGECVPYATSVQVVHGGWSAWSGADCRRCSCPAVVGALGVIRSYRRCDSPPPFGGGLSCAGDNLRGVVCDRNCPSAGVYASVQQYVEAVCAGRKAAKPDLGLTGYGRRLINSEEKLCKVFCEVSAYGDRKNYRFLGDLLPDGVPCDAGRHCLDGKCLPLLCGNTILATDKATCTSNGKCLADNGGVIWTAWTSWSACSVTCGYGATTRARTCVTPGPGPRASSGCPGHDSEKAACRAAECPPARTLSQNSWTDWGYGEYSHWSEWSVCSVTCGEGLRIRHRGCRYAGACYGPKSQEERCGEKPCVQWGGWGGWSACGHDGSRRRVRNCYGVGPKVCPGSDIEVAGC